MLLKNFLVLEEKLSTAKANYKNIVTLLEVQAEHSIEIPLKNH